MSEPEFTREHTDPDAPVHMSEPGGWMPCCGRLVLEVHPWRNRVTTHPELVTCPGNPGLPGSPGVTVEVPDMAGKQGKED